jgi:hypothetical protein
MNTFTPDEACVLQIVGRMGEETRPEWAPFDEAKVLLVREFLRREFRDCQHREFVAFEPLAKIFIVEAKDGIRRTLLVPRATFDADNFSGFFTVQLVDALERDRHVTLNPDGFDVHP